MLTGAQKGAALAASMILHHQIDHPSEPLLFRAAIFICSPVPFSYSLDYGIDTRTYFGLKVAKPSRAGCSTTVPKYLITDAAYLKGEEALEPKRDGQYIRSVPTYYQMFHPSADDIRIAIPTAHIYGRKDKWRLHSIDLAKLCRRDLASVLQHDGGHEVPRSASEEICDLIETVFAKVV